VRIARRAKCDRVLGVVQLKARCASVIACRCGTLMRAVGERFWPARPTRRCSGRASRPEIGALLERGIVPSVIPISTARR
jgi:hypothetical protein